jgi:DNA repair exonuclease SbcCD nuclease subunit
MKKLGQSFGRLKVSNPVAVVISDIHFNVKNLELASKSLKAALKKAENLKLPLIIAGDLNDTKAIIRAEVANVLCEIFKHARTSCYVMVGNHDLCNEKGTENSLHFLIPYVNLVDNIQPLNINTWMIPYYSDKNKLAEALKQFEPGSKLIMHQGFMGAAMGDYVQDSTSLDPELVKEFKVISGHYHRHQTIGTVTYIGSPYTMSFGEANDGDKGYLILNSNGSYERVILSFRRHKKFTVRVNELSLYNFGVTSLDDLIWLKIEGEESELSKIDKRKLGLDLFGHSNYKLELISTLPSQHLKTDSQHLTDEELFDSLINRLEESTEVKDRLKVLWKTLL